MKHWNQIFRKKVQLMKLLELIGKLEAIGLYASNEDLMMLDYEGGNGVITFTDDNGVDYYFTITENKFDMNAAGHAVQIRYQKRISLDTSAFINVKHKTGQLVEIEATIIFLTGDELLTKLQQAIKSFSEFKLK